MKKEPATAEMLNELSRRLSVCAAQLSEAARVLDKDGAGGMELAIGTAKTRINQIEGFCRTLDRNVQVHVNKIREDAIRYKQLSRNQN